MAPVSSKEKVFYCRNKDCNKCFTDRSNRNRHEKKSNHKPTAKKKSSQPLFNEAEKKYKCAVPGCSAQSKFKGNITRHMKDCSKINLRKEQKENNKVCGICGKRFEQKFNRDRHVKNQHSVPTFVSQVDLQPQSSHPDVPETLSASPETLNVSFLSNDGSVIETEMSLVDNETPIYEIQDVPMAIALSPIRHIDDSLTAANPTHEIDSSSTAANRTTDNPTNVIDSSLTAANRTTDNRALEINPSSTAICHTTANDTADGTNEANFSIGIELAKIAEKRDLVFEKQFKESVLLKMKSDLKSRFFKHNAAKYLDETFGEALEDDGFLRWLAKNIDYKTYRLKNLIENYKHQQKPRNSIDNSNHQKIYNFWLNEKNSIPTTDRRSGRDEIKVGKLRYLREYKHLTNIQDDNCKEKEIILKKTGKSKTYITAHRRIYTKPIRKLFSEFKESTSISCSLSTFHKYRPFYIGPPTEREKESCLCIKCQNAHLLLKGVNNFRKTKKLTHLTSATEFVNLPNSLSPEDLEKNHPEFKSRKETSYYVFEKKTETYIKNGVEKSYERTTRIDKTDKVCDIVKQLVDSGPNYLKHRQHVNNINKVLPKIRERHAGKYIEMDFSENIALKTKSEVQEAHFSGKQYALHCSIVEPGENKFVYHFSDDTTHDPCFVHQVLEDIFDRWDIKDETVLIKSDNAPTQYKNKWAFHSYQSLADKYNVRIVRLYGAAGHGKGLIDAMSSFGVKSILRRDIVGLDVWFANSQEMCDYLDLRKDPRMSYTVVSQADVDNKRMNKTEKKIDGCMVCHLFDYQPKGKVVYMEEFLCDCENCLDLDF